MRLLIQFQQAKHYIGLVLIFFSVDLSAQFFPAKVYTIQEGMPSNSIYDITQTGDGVMWFLTHKGIATYNSLDWKLFDDSLKLPNTAHSYIKNNQGDVVWTAGQNNHGFVLKKYDSAWLNIAVPKELDKMGGSFGFDVGTLGDDNVVVIAKDSLLNFYSVAKNLWQQIMIPGQNIKINSAKIYNNKAFICTSNGIWVYEEGLSKFDLKFGQHQEVLDVNWKDGNTYFLGIGWIASQDKTGNTKLLTEDNGIYRRSAFNKYNLEIDDSGRVFYSSHTRAKFIQKPYKKSRTLLVEGRVMSALSNRIFFDHEKNIWVGDHRGLFKFNMLRFQNYNQNTGLVEDEVSAILELDSNHLIIANSAYLNLFNNGTVINSFEIGKLPGVRVLDITENNGDVYIAGSQAGLLILKDNTLKRLNLHLSFDEKVITSAKNFKGTIYFTSLRALYRLENNTARLVAKIRSVRNISIVSDGIILCSSRGAYIYKEEVGLKKLFLSTLKSYNNIFDAEELNHNYLLATAGGVIQVNKETLDWSYVDGLDDIAAYSILKDRDYSLWIGSNEGVFFWNKDKIKVLNRSDGLIGNEVNRNALIEDLQGNIWIGTETGASVLNGHFDLTRSITPKLYLTQVSTDQADNVFQRMTLDYSNNSVSFSFLGISYFDESSIDYRYKLEGSDNEWQFIDHQKLRPIRYTNLLPGDYKFLVQAGLNGENWSEPKSIVFTVDSPLYLKTWFIVTAISLLIIVLYVIYRIRFIVILRQQQKLKESVKRRTKEIENKNLEIAEQNKVLLQQSEQIKAINERLEEMVKSRTQQLELQNERLLQYAFINSHKLRAPICRIQGLLHLLGISPDAEKVSILKLLRETGEELDQVTKQIDNALEDIDVFEYLRQEEENRNLNS